MKETFVGPPEDRLFIATYLAAIRALDPAEIATLARASPLSDLAGSCTSFDQALFDAFVHSAVSNIASAYTISLDLIDRKRYLVAAPPNSGDVGGFHDPHSLGYQYWFHAAFVALLNPNAFSSSLVTFELARSYIHDCLHHSTYRSFRRALRVPATDTRIAKDRLPELFREQYGFNFRNRDKQSYSPGALTAQSPATINLNLLMDGLVVRLTTDGLRPSATKVVATTPAEEAVLHEIMCEPFDAALLPAAERFRLEVIAPSSAFIKHWGDGSLLNVLVPAMTTGSMVDAKSYFARRVGVPTAWEDMFMRPSFTLDPNPTGES